MDQEYIKQKFYQWLETFVEVPHPALGGWPPCPYARQARLKGQIELVFSSVDRLPDAIYNSIPLFETKEVVVICFDHNKISGDELVGLVKNINQELMPKNFVILEDHPDVPEILNGLTMNFGSCGLLVMSELNKLNSAADQIRAKGYYDLWPQENLDAVVSWRYR